MITAGGTEGLFNTLPAAVGPGDEVVLAARVRDLMWEPAYPPIE